MKRIITLILLLASLSSLANRNYCRVSEDGKSLVQAPDWLTVHYSVTNVEWRAEYAELPADRDPTEEELKPVREWAETNIVLKTRVTFAPKDADYLAEGWYRKRVQPPAPPEGKVLKDTCYAVDGKYAVAVYTYEDAPAPVPAPVRYSKKKFDLALAKRGMYAQFLAWSESVEAIPNSGLTVAKLLSDSTWMQSDDAEFLAVKAVAEQKFGKETLDAVLKESEDSEW